MAEIENFIDAVLDQDFSKAGPMFSDLLGSKISDALDQEKISVADQIFNGASEDEDEDEEAEEMEFEEDDTELDDNESDDEDNLDISDEEMDDAIEDIDDDEDE